MFRSALTVATRLVGAAVFSAALATTASALPAFTFDPGAISCIGRESGSGTRDGFESITGTKDSCKLDQELTSTGGVIEAVAGNPNAIGYVSAAYLDDRAGKGAKPASLGRYRASIAKIHQLLDLKDPTQAELVKLRRNG